MYLKSSLRRIDHSSRGVLPTVVRRRVWSRNLENEEAKARYRGVENTTRWVVTPGKQTTNMYLKSVLRYIIFHFEYLSPGHCIYLSNDVRIRGCFFEGKRSPRAKKFGKKLHTVHISTGKLTNWYSIIKLCFLVCKLLSFLWQLLNSTLHSKHQNKYLFTNSLLWFWRMSLLMLYVLPLRRVERAQLCAVSPVSYKCTIYLVCTYSQWV
jgi:hypothetical protein